MFGSTQVDVTAFVFIIEQASQRIRLSLSDAKILDNIILLEKKSLLIV
jgi:hypothetical protein